VEVTAGEHVVLLVVDDGIGPSDPGPSRGDDHGHGHGLRNMEVRATRRGGTFGLAGAGPEAGRGSVVRWQVPRT
jgi:signal transduction histidine kinase